MEINTQITSDFLIVAPHHPGKVAGTFTSDSELIWTFCDPDAEVIIEDLIAWTLRSLAPIQHLLCWHRRYQHFNTHENPAVIASTSTKSSRPLAILLPKKWSVCKSRWPAQRTVVLHATPGWAGAGCRECACSGGDPVIAWQRTPSSRGSDLTRWVVMVVAAANTLSVSGVKWDHLPMLLWPN